MVWWTLLQLQHGGKQARRRAAKALRGVKTQRVVDALISALSDDDFEVSSTARAALLEAGSLAVEPLLAGLEFAGERRRRAIIAVLGGIGDSRAKSPLAELFLRGADWWTMSELAKALQKLKWQPPDTTSQARFAIAVEDWKLVAQQGEIAVEPILNRMQHGGSVDSEKMAAALVSIGQPAVRPLWDLLEREITLPLSPGVRGTGLSPTLRIAVRALEGINRPMLVGLAIRACGARTRMIGSSTEIQCALSHRNLPERGHCDLCYSEFYPLIRGTLLLTAAAFALIVHLGYDPFKRNRVDPALQAAKEATHQASAMLAFAAAKLASMSRRELLEGWREKVFSDTTEWALCPDCAKDLEAFLESLKPA